MLNATLRYQLENYKAPVAKEIKSNIYVPSYTITKNQDQSCRQEAKFNFHSGIK